MRAGLPVRCAADVFTHATAAAAAAAAAARSAAPCAALMAQHLLCMRWIACVAASAQGAPQPAAQRGEVPQALTQQLRHRRVWLYAAGEVTTKAAGFHARDIDEARLQI